MNVTSPKAARRRLDPIAYGKAATTGVTPRWLKMSVVRSDVEPGTTPSTIPQPRGRQPEVNLITLRTPCDSEFLGKHVLRLVQPIAELDQLP